MIIIFSDKIYGESKPIFTYYNIQMFFLKILGLIIFFPVFMIIAPFCILYSIIQLIFGERRYEGYEDYEEYEE